MAEEKKYLAVLFPPYPREMKTIKSGAILALACFYGNGAIYSHVRSIAYAWLKHAHSFDRWGDGDGGVAQHGGHTSNNRLTETCNLGLPRTSLASML